MDENNVNTNDAVDKSSSKQSFGSKLSSGISKANQLRHDYQNAGSLTGMAKNAINNKINDKYNAVKDKAKDKIHNKTDELKKNAKDKIDSKIPESVKKKQEAIKAKESSPSSDCFWVAYDLEDVSLENKRQAHEEAYRLAEANGINIALSAISFEVWLLLHFTPTPKTYLNSADAVRALRGHLTNYAKGNSGIFEKVKEILPSAKKNADALHRRQERNNPDSKPYERNPYTSFHLLLNAIDQIK